MIPRLERAILERGTEDWYSLYEVLGLTFDILPGEGEAERQSAAAKAVKKLIADGLIYLCLFTHSGGEGGESGRNKRMK